jgi:predicted transcriptional regulator
MNLGELIINDITPLALDQKINLIQQVFRGLTYSHIPVCDNGVFIGCISENDSHCFDSEVTVKDCRYAVEFFSVDWKTNWLEVLEAFAQNAANIMPVLKDGEYIGYYELKDIISLFDQTPFFYEVGAVLIVKKGAKDYSFSEISQIVESNNAKILGAFLTNLEDNIAEITLKINNTGLSDIMQTFRRYGYEIVAGHEDDTYIQSLKDRSDYFKKYMNI